MKILSDYHSGVFGLSDEVLQILLHLCLSQLFGVYILLEPRCFTIFKPPQVDVLCIDGFPCYSMFPLVSACYKYHVIPDSIEGLIG
jgi:hypothetical protein